MTRATIIWFVGAAVVGAAAGGLHLLRSQIGGAHTGLPLAVGAFGLTALAAAMLYHGVVIAAREQDAFAGPEPELVDVPESVDEPELPEHDAPEPAESGAEAQGSAEPEPAEAAPAEAAPAEAAPAEPESQTHDAPVLVVAAPERHDADPGGGDTAHDSAEPHAAGADEGPAVYTFRRGKPVRDAGPRSPRPPRRDRPA
ncbi:hypothetical protein GCM10009740_37480 [Terrabacter terrae]|uniref:Uncharacterized protein n=1 Tax=Terrabacter terrae TaxID=318434 RepID=A0ABP5G7N3_9MICO